MTTHPYRVESSHPIIGPFSSTMESTSFLLHDRSLAIVAAAKSTTKPRGKEIRVVHTPTGQVVFSKTSPGPEDLWDDQPAMHEPRSYGLG
jgi:hypothetical protein